MSSNKSDFLRDARIWDFVARNADDEIARGGGGAIVITENFFQ